jgi:hypothetical protein
MTVPYPVAMASRTSIHVRSSRKTLWGDVYAYPGADDVWEDAVLGVSDASSAPTNSMLDHLWRII